MAMSRSIGDGLAHQIGVICEPGKNPVLFLLEVKELSLEPCDKFIVIASDGVWEFLSNEAIADIVWPFFISNQPEKAGNAIVKAAA